MLPYSTKNTTAHYAVSVCWNWMQSIKSNEKCLGNERERINLWHSQFNKLFELRMYAVNVLCGTTKSNQIKVLNARTYIHLVCIRCISVHLNVRTITSTHSIFRGGRMVWVRSVHLKSLWYEKLCSSVCTEHCEWKGYKLPWWTAHNNISIDCLPLFVKHA